MSSKVQTRCLCYIAIEEANEFRGTDQKFIIYLIKFFATEGANEVHLRDGPLLFYRGCYLFSKKNCSQAIVG